MPFDSRFSHLFKMAAKRPISEFQQAVHTGDRPVTVIDPRTSRPWQLSAQLHAKVTGGFCLGASLDWLRKVLQGEKKAVSHLKMSRVTRMAQVHDRQGEVMKRANPVAAAMRKERDALRSRADDQVEAAKSKRDAFQRDAVQWIEANGGTWNNGSPRIRATAEVVALFNQKMEQLNAMTSALGTVGDDVSKQADALTEQANQFVENISKAEHRAALWDQMALELDSVAGKQRKFSGIFPIASSAKEKYSAFKDFLVAALSATGFAPGRGMLLSLALVPEPGHAIALYRESSSTTLLFDANLGVYKFQDFKLLVHGLVILAELGYQGRDPDGKVTTLGDTHAWQIFCRSEGLPALGKEQLLTDAEAMLACDAAHNTIEISAQLARELMDDTLREAKRLKAAYDAKETPENQEAWVAVHNEATLAVAAAGGDPGQARSLYPGFTGRALNIV